MTYRQRMEAVRNLVIAAGLKGNAGRVMLELAQHGLESELKIALIARSLLVSERTVTRILGALERDGHLKIMRDEGFANTYLIRLPQSTLYAHGVPEMNHVDKTTPDTSVRGQTTAPLTNCQGGGDTSVRGSLSNYFLKAKYTPQAEQGGDLFADAAKETAGRLLAQIESTCRLPTARGIARRRAEGDLASWIDLHGMPIVARAVQSLPTRLPQEFKRCHSVGGAMFVLKKHVEEAAKLAAHRAAEEQRQADQVRLINAEREKYAGDRENLAAARAKWSRMDESERAERRAAIVATSPKLLRDAPATVDLLAIKAIAEGVVIGCKSDGVTA